MAAGHLERESRNDASDLPATIERARALLDEGDVVQARFLANRAYDDAKAAFEIAARFGASEQLIAKARQLQGDALMIETRANIALADLMDDARTRGLISKGGRPRKDEKPVSAADRFLTVEEIGLTREALSQARKLRDAERREPGIAERAIAARVAAGFAPTKANLRAAIGTKTATKEERGDDLYETPECATRTLLAVEKFGPVILEPACGKGAISHLLEDAGHEVILSDLVDRGTVTADGECQRVCDFLESREGDFGHAQAEGADFDIVTNPPFGIANRFIRHALAVHQPAKMAMLLNLNFMCGFEDEDRNWIWENAPPARVHVFTRRLPMMHRDGWDGPRASSQMNTAWFVWERVEASEVTAQGAKSDPQRGASMAKPLASKTAKSDPADLHRIAEFYGTRCAAGAAVDDAYRDELIEKHPYGLRTELRRVDWKDYE